MQSQVRNTTVIALFLEADTCDVTSENIAWIEHYKTGLHNKSLNVMSSVSNIVVIFLYASLSYLVKLDKLFKELDLFKAIHQPNPL